MLPRSSPYRPASQSPSIRCATWGGGSDEPSELASTSLSTAPHYPNLLCIKSAQTTTWLCKATPIHILSVKTVKQALASRQWQPPRTMALAGILFEEIAPNSSSPAFRASQIGRVFTAYKTTFSARNTPRIVVPSPRIWLCHGREQSERGCRLLRTL